ncbi:MAG TPA: ATP-binding protein, partial [Thermoguttaceae bacterium]|nr:ATP-binding protein [Thermoguttaceae bacterium]
KILAFGMMVLSAVSLLLGAGAAWRGFTPWIVWLVGGCLGGMCGLAAGWLLWRNFCQDQAALRSLNYLAELTTEGSSGQEALARFPSGPHKDAFFAALRKVAEAVSRLRERCQEADHLRTRQEVRLRRMQSEYQQMNTILSGLADPMLALNEYGELVWVNPSAEVLLVRREKQDRPPAAEVIECPKLVELLQTMTQRKTTGTRCEDIEWTDPAGKTHYYRAVVTKLGAGSEHPDSTALSVVAVLRDIGDQKALQKRHAEFVSSVSHEMKTPLAGIKAYVELLADGEVDDPETQQEFFRTIAGQVERLQRLVENLLNLARIEAGVVQVRKQAQSLNEILEEALRVTQPAAEGKQIRLEADLSPLYLNVYVDRDMLLQTAINLLSNAVKYTPSGGQVVLRSRLEDRYAQFEVEDTGVGLSEEDCRRVFEKFYRVQKDANMASGTGLGLPLAKHIVEDVHGGSLTVQSKLGEGSVFRVRLPLLARHWDNEAGGSATDSDLAPAASS